MHIVNGHSSYFMNYYVYMCAIIIVIITMFRDPYMYFFAHSSVGLLSVFGGEAECG